MSVMYERPRAGGFIVSEGNKSISRDAVVIGSGALEAGTVLGRVAATGVYLKLDPAAEDGSESAAGILFDAVDASAGAANGVAITRLAEVNGAELIWPDGIDGGDKDAALTELAAQHIIVR